MKEKEERSGEMGKEKICIECGAKDTYEFKDTIRKYQGDGYHFKMSVNVPFCKKCGAPIYDEETEREIAQKANEKIREQRGTITREEILEILDLYNVSQKFLSKLLGWGEITLTRYISGNYTPNAANSSRLKELKNPYVFQMLLQNYCDGELEKNDEKLLQKAQIGLNHELHKLKDTQGKIFNVVNWFLSQSSEDAPITHLALQKLLYFVQNWSRALIGEGMFCDDCQAWVHGAVYPNVYEVFKQFKYAPLPRVEDSFAFEDQEWKILNAVKEYYFDIYSAKALEEICHRERPYVEARKGIPEGETCHTVIDVGKITSYYKEISKKYNINLLEMSNIKDYLNEILNY